MINGSQKRVRMLVNTVGKQIEEARIFDHGVEMNTKQWVTQGVLEG